MKANDTVAVSSKTLSDWVDGFEALLFAGQVVDVTAHLPPRTHRDFDRISSEVLRVALEYESELGNHNYFNILLETMPWIAEHKNIIGPLAFEDYRLRLGSGQSVSMERYASFGVETKGWQNWLKDAETSNSTTWRSKWGSTAGEFGGPLFGSNSVASKSTHGQTSSDASWRRRSDSQLPSAGELLGEFQLMLQIGSGTFSRVFIARQISLASRPIVLKVATMPLGESARLAQLQHANIMPLFFAEAVDGFYLLGMPLLGLVTLKDVIERAQNVPGRSGSLIAELIEQRAFEVSKMFPELASFIKTEQEECLKSPLPIDEYRHATWEQAVLSITAKLADGLKYANRRGIQHRDVKPANILLGFDGQPMLLDFNLSRESSAAEDYHSLGGTLPYMSPEELSAWSSSDAAKSVTAEQSDLYSLGVVLYESLTGTRPHDFTNCPSGDIDVAASLRKSAIVPASQRWPELRPAANAIVLKCLAYEASRRYEDTSELGTDIRLHLSDRPLRHCANPSIIERLKKFAKRKRYLISTGSLAGVAAALLLIVMFSWMVFRQKELKRYAREQFAAFGAASQQAESSLFFADGGSRESGRQQALDALALVGATQDQPFDETLLRFLDHTQKRELEARSMYLQALLSAESGVGSDTFSSTATNDRMILATQAYFDGEYAESISILDAELDSNPQRFVVWFLKGRAHFNLNEFRQAKQAFQMATVLEPNSAISWVSRGTCDYQLAQFAEAITYYDRAIEVDPKCFAAYYNRALALEKQHAYSQALKSLDSAEQIKPDSTRVHMARSRIARADGNLDLANAELQLVLEHQPTEPVGFILRGLAKLPEDAESSLQDFEEAKRWPTTRSMAFQNSAHVLSEILGRRQPAIQELTELLEEDADFQPAIVGRAVLYARDGNSPAALADVARCLSHSVTAETHYQIACVYSLLAAHGESYVEKALFHLSLATQPLYGAHDISSDRDLENLRDKNEFRTLMAGIEAGIQMQSRKPD